MNKDLTLVFSSYQSKHLLQKILKRFQNKYKTIIIENSLDIKIKVFLEKKFKNTEVIIPNENLGLARSYNLGFKKAKTKFVFLNNPDMEITDNSIKNLIYCAKKIKKFGALSPCFMNEKIYKNYEIFKKKNQTILIYSKNLTLKKLICLIIIYLLKKVILVEIFLMKIIFFFSKL